jgi:hypothetical protein
MQWPDPDRRQAHERPEEDEALRKLGRELTWHGRIVAVVGVAAVLLIVGFVVWWLTRGAGH